MTQKILITAYNTDEDAPIDEEEIFDAISPLGLGDVDIQIIEEED